MKKSILLLSALFALTSCGSGSGNIALELDGDEYGPTIKAMKQNKDSYDYYNCISILPVSLGGNATLSFTTADFTAKNGTTTLNALAFIDSYALAQTSTYFYYIVETSTSKNIKIQEGVQSDSIWLTFDTSLDVSYSIYYKNIELKVNEFIGI